MNISYNFGIVDLFHYGHLYSIKKAAEKADLCVFGLVSDEAAAKWLGKIVSNEMERFAVVQSNKYVDRVMKQETLDPLKNLKKLHKEFPDAVITLYHGNDISVIPAEKYLNSIGGSVRLLDYYERLSPDNILEILNSKQDTVEARSNIISTKANTLEALKDRIKNARIEDIYICTVERYRNEPDDVYGEINNFFNGGRIVVRSSSKNEDCFETSNAGHFDSVLDVDSSDRDAVIGAIGTVVGSYGRDEEADPDDQVLVQRMTTDVRFSGVMFSRDLQFNRPYYVINYDDNGSTDMVTSGMGGKTLWIAHDTDMGQIPDRWIGLLTAFKELENILKGIMLDVEFAVTGDGGVVIFQVRPLAANYRYLRDTDDEKYLALKNSYIKDYGKVKIHDRPIFSDMAFWNPAEIIGNNPYQLDYSLYKEIITKTAWNEGLVPMGYQKVADNLMYRFGNKPYISVDYSFKSLTPDDVDSGLTRKLINYYRECLLKDKSSHDKIEFEIVLSCYDFDMDSKLGKLIDNGFSQEETHNISNALFNLTDSAIKGYREVWRKDSSDLRKLEAQRKLVETVIQDPYSDVHLYVGQLSQLLKVTRTYGTPQFARQARYAFIAKALLNSLVNRGYITESEYNEFMSGVSTVAEDLDRDLRRMQDGSLSMVDFNREYGHLRAGTYDIRTPRYDDMAWNIGNEMESGNDCRSKEFPDGVRQGLVRKIEPAIKEAGFSFSAELFVDFAKKAMEQREYFKFVFTRSLSRGIEIIAKIGETLGIERRLMSYVEVAQIKSLRYYDDDKEMRNFLLSVIDSHKREYGDNLNVILPELISGASDFNIINVVNARPNFITDKSVDAKVCVLDNGDSDIKGKIVAIEKADPGYDWIFTKGIAGLVTKYGGVASHMAIRCAEFKIPAAIGCGEKIFEFVKSSGSIHIDCKNNTITR
jgi:cytidyltransferase-like protein